MEESVKGGSIPVNKIVYKAEEEDRSLVRPREGCFSSLVLPPRTSQSSFARLQT